MWFLILVVLVVGGYLAYKFRVPLLAKVLGQPEHRIARSSSTPHTPQLGLPRHARSEEIRDLGRGESVPGRLESS